MRRLIIAIIILIAGYYECPAQLIKSYGIKVALTSAHDGYENIRHPDIKSKRRLGFNIGVFVEWLNDPMLSIITQVEYVQKGCGWDVNRRDEYNHDYGIVTYYRRLDYISVPIIIKFKIQTLTLTPFIMAGPRLDFLIGNHYVFDDPFSLYNMYKKNVAGASIGIGFQTSTFLNTKIMTEIRYNFDFEDSFNNGVVKTRNSSYDLWIGLSF